MAMVDELGATGDAEKGCFVMWQMVPNKWLIELVVNGHKVVAGSDGNVAWRHTPWLGSHAAKGGVRPLRRSLQASQIMTLYGHTSLVRSFLQNYEVFYIIKASIYLSHFVFSL